MSWKRCPILPSVHVLGQVSQLRRDSNPQQHPFHTQATEGRFTVCVRYCRDLTEMGWGARIELSDCMFTACRDIHFTNLTMVGLTGLEPALSTLSSLCLCQLDYRPKCNLIDPIPASDGVKLSWGSTLALSRTAELRSRVPRRGFEPLINRSKRSACSCTQGEMVALVGLEPTH